MKKKRRRYGKCGIAAAAVLILAVLAGIKADSTGTLSRNSEKLLEEMAESDTTVADILEHQNRYPVFLLEALANNGEMADFVAGYEEETDWNGYLEAEEAKAEFPLLLQWDSRWGYNTYGTSIIGISGCGPTCMAMVITALTHGEDATPAALAQYSMEKGYYVAGTGTAWDFMTAAAQEYGLEVWQLGLDENRMKKELDEGHPIICAMRAGDFTTGGHFIVLYGYDEEGFLLNDPNSRARSEKSWSFQTLCGQIKNLWCYSCDNVL